jgi:hypothetical protein
MLPTIQELETAAADIAAYFAAPVVAIVARVAPVSPPKFAASLPATKTSPTNTIEYAAGTAIIDGKGKGNIGEYRITEFPADGGRAFHFAKLEGGTDAESSSYDVFLADERTADAGFAYDSCDCRGFLRHGHCKHRDTARAIADRTVPARRM